MKKHKTENQLRNDLLQFMNKTGFTANFIGKEVGCHPQTITNWVNGEKSMRIETYDKINKFINQIEK